jgi:hypothetical protein
MSTAELKQAAAVDLTPLQSQPLAHVEQARPLVSPEQVLAQAIQSGATIEQMERLMALAERMRAQQIEEEKRQAEKAFRADFARFKALNIVVPKTKQVTQRSKSGDAGPTYKQTEFDVVASLLQPALASCNFGYRFDVQFHRGGEADLPWCEVTCKLEHSAGHVETLKLGGPPDDSGTKNPLQEMQSSATFLMRHALLAITGTAQAGNDNDGRGARGYREEEEAGGSAQEPKTNPLTQRGKDEAMNGVAALNKWWGSLSAKDRSALQGEFGGWLRCARQADGKGHSHE